MIKCAVHFGIQLHMDQEHITEKNVDLSSKLLLTSTGVRQTLKTAQTHQAVQTW